MSCVLSGSDFSSPNDGPQPDSRGVSLLVSVANMFDRYTDRRGFFEEYPIGSGRSVGEGVTADLPPHEIVCDLMLTLKAFFGDKIRSYLLQKNSPHFTINSNFGPLDRWAIPDPQKEVLKALIGRNFPPGSMFNIAKSCEVRNMSVHGRLGRPINSSDVTSPICGFAVRLSDNVRRVVAPWSVDMGVFLVVPTNYVSLPKRDAGVSVDGWAIEVRNLGTNLAKGPSRR
ncbi:MAG: hypothetical protein WC897_01430 [Candidatus Gracilibacteria bacterium]